MRNFVFDLLHRGKGDNAKAIFLVMSRVIRDQDTSIATFFLPFAALNIVVGGTAGEGREIGQEMLTILQFQLRDASAAQVDMVKQCSEVSCRATARYAADHLERV